MSELYEKIEALCRQHGTNVTRMCREAGISRAPLSDLKMGRSRTLSAATLAKIAAHFGVTVDFLLGQEEAPAHDLLDEVDLAFYGEYRELSEDDKDAVRDFVRVMRQRRARQDGAGE